MYTWIASTDCIHGGYRWVTVQQSHPFDDKVWCSGASNIPYNQIILVVSGDRQGKANPTFVFLKGDLFSWRQIVIPKIEDDGLDTMSQFFDSYDSAFNWFDIMGTGVDMIMYHGHPQIPYATLGFSTEAGEGTGDFLEDG